MLVCIFFYLFGLILVGSAFRVITAKNSVHAVLYLVLCFVTSSALWIMLDVEFLALTLIVVYVGAVMVLFLFVVMMLDIDIEAMRKGFWRNLPLALIIGLIIAVEMVTVLVTKPLVIMSSSELLNGALSNSNQLGLMLYTEYSYPVELASIILLVGLVVAVALTLRQTNKNAKYQNVSKQVAITHVGRIEMIKMKSEVEKEIAEKEIIQ